MGAWAHIHEAERLADPDGYPPERDEYGEAETQRAIAHALIAIAKSLAVIHDPASTPEAVVAGAEDVLDRPLRPIVRQVRRLSDPDFL